MKQKIAIDITTHCTRWHAHPSVNRWVKQAVRNTLLHAAAKNTQAVHVDITLTNNRRIKALNKQWRHKDCATNILSFPTHALADPIWKNGPTATPLGDLVLALETIQAESLAENKTLRQHVMHLTVHGMLHLLGYSHETDAKHRKMVKQEVDICAQMNIPNPYRHA